MTETTEGERAHWRTECKYLKFPPANMRREDMLALVSDADRLAAIEQWVRELADLWDQQQSEYPDTQEGEVAAAAVRCCARELRAILDSPSAGTEDT